MFGMFGFDLAAATRHCDVCEIEWFGRETKCWVCGRRGEPGRLDTAGRVQPKVPRKR